MFYAIILVSGFHIQSLRAVAGLWHARHVWGYVNTIIDAFGDPGCYFGSFGAFFMLGVPLGPLCVPSFSRGCSNSMVAMIL